MKFYIVFVQNCLNKKGSCAYLRLEGIRKEDITMPPRHGFPMQGGMGPRMMGGPGPQGRMGSMGMNPFQQRPLMGQMMGRSGQMNGGGGGLLSRLFGGGNQTRAMGGMAAASRQAGAGGAGSLLKSLSNPGAINGFLNNTQQILQSAQSVGPMIQQYGPLVKNLPAMWKLYRGLKNSSSDTDETTSVKPSSSTQTESSSAEEIAAKKRTSAKKKKKKQKTESTEKKTGHNRGNSVPRLYI